MAMYCENSSVGPTISDDLGSMILGSKILGSKMSGNDWSSDFSSAEFHSQSMGMPMNAYEASKLSGLPGMFLAQPPKGLTPSPAGLPPPELSFNLSSDLGSKILQSKGLSSGASTQSTCTPTSVLEDFDDMDELDNSTLVLDAIQEQDGSLDQNSFMQGDYYCEKDITMRGITIGCDMPMLYTMPWEGSSIGKAADFGDIGPLPVFSSTSFGKFKQEDTPPLQPRSQHFQLKPTTVHIMSNMPHTIGNSILDFLESQVVASISKVNGKKYTIKADAFLENIKCSTKIRIWQTEQEKQEFAIEVQRRGGDAFAFEGLYQQLSSFLAERFPEATRDSTAGNGQMLLPPPPPLGNVQRSEQDIAQLLDMIAMEHVPTVQAEAASVLAKLSCEDPQIATLLCKEESFDGFVKLFADENLDINYPAARLVSALAMCTEVKCLLAEHNLLKIVIDKVANKATGQIVRLELVKAISATVHRCASLISADTAQELHLSLENAKRAMQNLDKNEACVVESQLQEAMLYLSQHLTIQ